MSIEFSIIVPVFNIAKYIPKCLESVLMQEYGDYEIIIINDGSSDDSKKICENYKKKYPQKIKLINKCNAGLSAARNTGIDAAEGVYLIFLDGDDYWKDNFLSNLSVVCKNLDDFIWGNGYIIDDNINFENRYRSLKFENFQNINAEQALLIFLEAPFASWSAWQHIYKRSLIIENNLYFRDGILCEDSEWTFKVALIAKSFNVFDHLYYNYRTNRPDSIMQGVSFKRWKDMITICEEWFYRTENIESEILKESLLDIYGNTFYDLISDILLFNDAQQIEACNIVKKSKYLLKTYTTKNRLKSISIRLFGIRNTLKTLTLIKNIRIKLSKKDI